jgi:hypothetical protein
MSDPRRINFQGEMIFWHDLCTVSYDDPEYPGRVELGFIDGKSKYFIFKSETEAEKQAERLLKFLLPEYVTRKEAEKFHTEFKEWENDVNNR